MSFSAANDLNLSGGVKTSSAAATGASPNLNLSSSTGIGSANISPNSVVNRSILKELNTNDNNNMLSTSLTTKTSLSGSKALVPSPSSITQSAVSSEMHTSKTPMANSSSNTLAITQNVSPAGGGAFEANSTLHKFTVDPELETGVVFDDHHEVVNELNNTSGSNKSSNKFVGLTEFDEDKIPDLPGDLNPNIEEQYCVTYEECFIPTLEAKQKTKSDECFTLAKTHLLLPNEAAETSISNSNETFSDCLDDRDPLAITYLEQPNMCDTTSNGDGYESALNDLTYDDNDDHSMAADITMEIGLNQTQTIDGNIKSEAQQQDTPLVCEEADEPMDVDMNSTIEIINKPAENIQNVERVSEYIGNVLQHLDEEKENIVGDNRHLNICENKSLTKQTESSKINFTMVNSQTNKVEAAAPHSPHLEIEQSIHDVSLNKSVELPVKRVATTALSSKCVKAAEVAVINEKSEMELIKPSIHVESLSPSKESGFAIDKKNSSFPSVKSPIPTKLNSSLNVSTSTKSLSPSAAPVSPTFPIKEQPFAQVFPKSQKSRLVNPSKPTFLEKSDYVDQLEQKLKQKSLENKTQECYENTNSVESEEPMQINKRRTFTLESVGEKQTDNSTTSGMTFPVKTNLNNSRRTFCIDDVSDGPLNKTDTENNNSRRTFNISSDEVQTKAMNTSIEPMDVDEDLNQTTNKLSHESAHEQKMSELQDAVESRTQLASSASMLSEDVVVINNVEEKSFDPSSVQNISESPPLPLVENDEMLNLPNVPKNESISSELAVTKKESDLNSMLPTLAAVQKRSDSPPLPTSKPNISNSPPLAAMQNRSDSPPLPTSKQNTSSSLPMAAMQNRSDSPPLPASKQNISKSPPLPTMQNRSVSPPLPALKNASVSDPSTTMKPPITQKPAMPEQQSHLANQKVHEDEVVPKLSIKEEQIVPPVSKILKRPSIRDYGSREKLSAKEQSNTKIKDEKDELVEYINPSPLEDMFATVTATSTTLTNTSDLSSFEQNSSASPPDNWGVQGGEYDDEFQGNNNLILNPSDFDYLLTKGNNNIPVDRSSLLLKFDPLLGVPVPSNKGQQQPLHIQTPATNNLNNNQCLSPTIEEDEHNDIANRSFVVENSKLSLFCGLGKGAAGSASSVSSASLSSAKSLKERSQEVKQQLNQQQQQQQQQTLQNKRQLPQPVNKKNATMSVDVIKDMSLDNNDCNKTFEHSNSTQSDDKQINYKMDELEKKIKNEVLKTEDIEKKLKDAELREEALIKRITEKDKNVAKMTGVIEAYEKAIAELIAEKEQLIQNYEQQLAEVKSDRDSNYHHLTSLETTFSDLHVKYEKSKEMTCQLKGNEDSLIAENRKNADNLRLQEQRYDKMKNHAMQQLEIANKKLECLTREHTMEITKLKALLKKEEIARSSMSEQLAQKTKENTELVKICDELIQGQGS